MAKIGLVPQSDSLLSLEDQIWEIDSNDLRILGKLGEGITPEARRVAVLREIALLRVAGSLQSLGNFGAVMKGDYLGTPVAVKKLFQLNDANYDMNKYMAREIAVLKSLHHPNIVQFIGISLLGVTTRHICVFLCAERKKPERSFARHRVCAWWRFGQPPRE